jgi:hypothetical protein
MSAPGANSGHPEHCLNCGKHLRGRYCSNCGQDSWEHQDSIWHLIRHFFNDITHYDGKLWKTVKPLLVKPGFLTQEYMNGKRASYLNPVRLFIFLNFIFFLLIAWLPSSSEGGKPHNVNIKFGVNNPTLLQYDSIQNTKPAGERDGPLKRALMEKLIGNGEKLNSDPKLGAEVIKIFLHNAGSLTFLFLLFSTGFLGLLYWRRHVLMINHALFSIHVSSTFLLLSVFLLFISYLPFGDWLALVFFIYGNYYFYKALRNVYGQSFIKTSLKFIAMEVLLATVMGAAATLYMLYAIMNLKS